MKTLAPAAAIASLLAQLAAPAAAQYGYPGGGYPGQGGRIVRCESWQYAYRECRVDTRGGVQLSRIIAGDCQQAYSWGWRAGVIWVNRGCRADFATGYGGGYPGGGGYPQPGYEQDNGPSAGAVIGGVAIAAGLIALLAKSDADKKKAAAAAPAPAATRPSGGPAARISVNAGGVEPAARGPLGVCLGEAAREIGATGGTEIRLDRFDSVERGNGGYRFRFTVKAIYPDQTRDIPMFCRATPVKLIELTFG